MDAKMAEKMTTGPNLSDEELIVYFEGCKNESDDAKKDRLRKNKENWSIYLGQQDWSHKIPGQSTETLPKMAVAAEQFSSYVKRSLVQFGDWFTVKVTQQSPLAAEEIRSLLQCYLRNVSPQLPSPVPFTTLVGDAVKVALMESLVIFKVHGYTVSEPTFTAEGGKLTRTERKVWKLRIDLIPTEDYGCDPTGRGMYEFHIVEKDLQQVIEMAEAGVYDLTAVKKITEDFVQQEKRENRPEEMRNQNESTPSSNRHRVQVAEFWGTIIGPDGRVVMKNAMFAIANGKYVIRKPQTNPWWHGESPFVVAPLIRVPFSVWGKALYDHSRSLNEAYNELYNLILDGAIGAVWGNKQLRPDWLKDPSQVANGVPQGMTLLVNEEAPLNGKVLESVAESAIPADAINVLNLTEREFQAASLTNDIRMGFLPPRAVKATEVIQQEQNQSAVLDSIAGDLESLVIEQVIRKAWLVTLQNADDLAADEIVAAIGPNAAFKLAHMNPAERFATFYGAASFRVMGLSNTLSKTKDFQKLMAMMQTVATNPLLMQAFFQKYSAQRILDFIMRALNINPLDLAQTPEEQAGQEDQLQQLQQVFSQLAGAGGSPPATGPSNMQGEINQGANPTGGY